MRVIAGEYRGRVLKSPLDDKTRPTSDRLRETLFNIISPRIDNDTRFLDLCAGSGAVGIEALSRRAGFVTFVDKSRKACSLIEINLDLLNILENQTEVLQSSAEDFLRRIDERTWNIVFFDPPYKNDYLEVLFKFGELGSKILSDDGILIAEHHSKLILPDEVGELRRWRLLKQSDSSLSFYEKK